ncbi:uncharacterized protein LOC124253024 [Haliotis rubra]|uniref:uncharacterized protein LOC124253024 n=1 Tax=Haliotis rubra TaxID=36100 RepID=UPI001EE544F7|nr:uncharacterized protein LOC124253024 [Haliotis rubra]
MADFFSFLQSTLSQEKQMEDAVNNNDMDRVCELIKDYKINNKVQQQGGNTALHLATRLGHKEIVKKLLEAGADPMLKNDFNLTPIDTATRKSHQDCLILLLRYATNFPAISVMWLQSGGSMILWKEATDVVMGTLLCATPNFGSTRSNTQNNLFFRLVDTKMLHSLKLLVMTGYKLTNEQKLKLESSDEKQFLEWLKSYLFKPQSLQHYCRIAIRQAFESRFNVFYGTRFLPLPASLRDFVCLDSELHSMEKKEKESTEASDEM